MGIGGWLTALLNLLGMGGSGATTSEGPLCGTPGATAALTATPGAALRLTAAGGCTPLLTATAGAEVC